MAATYAVLVMAFTIIATWVYLKFLKTSPAEAGYD
jgi:hypothetical protein